MKLQKAFPMRAMCLVGLGAALLLSTPVRAQQEVDPTYFDVNPGAPYAAQQASARDFNLAQEEQMLAQPVTDLAESSNEAVDSSLVRITATDLGVLAILFGGICLIALYAMAATRREREPQAFVTPAYSSTHGATVR